MLRILVAGVVAGIAMFLWGFVSHVVLGLTDRTVKPIPAAGEAAIVQALTTALPGPGVYIYPTGGVDMKDPNAMKRMDEILKTSPAGIITMAAPPGGAMPPKKMAFQLLGDMLAALVAGIALSMARQPSYIGRVFAVAVMGLFAGCLVNLPYWNWYGFPSTFTLADMLDHVMRSLAAGLVLGAMIQPR